MEMYNWVSSTCWWYCTPYWWMMSHSVFMYMTSHLQHQLKLAMEKQKSHPKTVPPIYASQWITMFSWETMLCLMEKPTFLPDHFELAGVYCERKVVVLCSTKGWQRQGRYMDEVSLCLHRTYFLVPWLFPLSFSVPFVKLFSRWAGLDTVHKVGTDQSRINKTITLCDLETIPLHHKFVFAFFQPQHTPDSFPMCNQLLFQDFFKNTIIRFFIIQLHDWFPRPQVQSCAFPCIKFHSIIFCPLC